jgi:hypothetical protein
VRLREIDHSIIITLSGAEPCRELIDRKEMPVRGVGRIVNILEKVIQIRLIPERQDNRNAHCLSFGKPSERPRLTVHGHCAHMMR